MSERSKRALVLGDPSHEYVALAGEVDALEKERDAALECVAKLKERIAGLEHLESVVREQLRRGALDWDELDAAIAEMEGGGWDDAESTPEDEPIAAAYPTRSGRHDLYAEAMRLVGARRSKGSLVALVNWLLVRAEPT